METKVIMEQVKEELLHRGYKNTDISIVHKNNDVIPALTVRLEEHTAAPAIYPQLIEEMNKPGMTISELADEVIRFTGEHVNNAPDISRITDRKFLLENVRLAVTRTDWNNEMLSEMPHLPVAGTDLSIYPRVHISNGCTIRPTAAVLEQSGISAEEILSAARKNSAKEYTVRDMMEVMKEMYGLENEIDLPAAPEMLIISNAQAIDGASAICEQEVLEEARNMLGSETVYIIPSSTHELIMIPSSTAGQMEIAEMITDVNTTCVERHDVLSDHPYVYDGKSLSMQQSEKRDYERASGRSR